MTTKNHTFEFNFTSYSENDIDIIWNDLQALRISKCDFECRCNPRTPNSNDAFPCDPIVTRHEITQQFLTAHDIVVLKTDSVPWMYECADTPKFRALLDALQAYRHKITAS